MELNWIKIGGVPTEEKPLVPQNRVASLHIGGKHLYLTNFKGEYFAGEHRCPHAGGELTQGWLDEEGGIVCPLHRFCFDLESGKNTSGEGFFVQTYPIEVRKDGVFIGLPKKKWWQFW